MDGQGKHIHDVEQFNVICAFDVLDHLPWDDGALKQIHQTLERGGDLIITVPKHLWLWSRDDDPRHVRRCIHEDICRKLAENGFSIISIRFFISFPLPLLIVSRLIALFKYKTRQINPQQGKLHFPNSIDVLFETVYSEEKLLINHTLSFRIGGSLLKVAARR